MAGVLPAGDDASLRPSLRRVLVGTANTVTRDLLRPPRLDEQEEGLAAGAWMGPYRLQARLGQGGMGAYDNKGDLFCDAYGTHDRAFTLYELAKGASSVTTIPVSETGITAGPVQWDGEYLTVGSGALGTLYQLALTPSKGSVAGSTTLNGTGWVWQFWITDTKGTKKKPQGTRVIAPTYAGSDGAETGYWNYPAGGNATQAIPGYAQPDGAALSIGKT